MMKSFLLLYILLFLNFKASALDKIIGGEDASFSKFPFVVSLGFPDGGGGSIIAKNWILTAAHVGDVETVYIGSNKLDSHKMIEYKIEKNINHPNSTGIGEDGADIRLLKLERPIDFKTTGAKIIKLADKSFENRGLQKPGTSAVVLGWGYTGDNNPGQANNILQYAKVPIRSLDHANHNRSYGGQVLEDMLPAGYDVGEKDACIGDSGGPLVVLDESRNYYVQVGVVSWGEQCALPFKFGIYSKVSSYYSWIQKTISKN